MRGGEERLRAAGERERPRHLVEPEELAGLLLEQAPLGQLAQQAADPDLQLRLLQRLRALDVVGLLGRTLRVEAVEDEDAHVGAEGLAHAADGGRHRRVAERVRDDQKVGRAVDDALHDAAPGHDDAHAVPTRAQQARDLLGPIGVLVDDRDVAERARDRRRDHPCAPKSPRLARSIDVNRFTIERSAARAMGFTRYESPPASRPAV